MATTSRTNTSSTIRWWWKKSSNSRSKKTPPSIKSSVPSSINGADEDASMFSLYSYGESMFTPSSVHNISSSIRAQHTKSEYSNMSDVESNASILSKPWISRNMITPGSDQPLKQDEADDTDEEDIDSFISDSLSYSLSQVNKTSLSDILDFSKMSMEEEEEKDVSFSAPPTSPPRRRGSLVDYIVNKPLHGRLKVILYDEDLANKNLTSL